MGKVHPDERVMAESFTTSYEGKLISVDYSLRAYVKHDAWNEFGEGNCVKLPIKIYMPPLKLISQVQIVQPQDWSPAVQESVHFSVAAEHQQ